MSISTYSPIRSQTPGVTFSAGTGGSLTSGSAWFCVQALNRVGRNLLSTPVQVTWGSSGKVSVTIASTARAAGEEIFEYVISAASSNTPADMKRLFSWRSRNDLTIDAKTYAGQGTYKSLPQTIELTQDLQVAIAPTVATYAALPTTNLLYGMVRYVTAIGGYVSYDDKAIDGLYAASTGYWISVSMSDLNTYLSATTSAGGCDRPLADIQPSDVKYPPPSYSGSGSDSYPLRLCFSNGLTEDAGAAEPQGTRLTLQLAANGRNVTDAFSGRAFFTLVGYYRRSTGAIDTSIPTVGDSITWVSTDSPVELPQDLSKGYGALYDIVFRFRTAELQSVIQRGAQITTLLYPEGLLGQPDSSWNITGDVVLDVGGKMRILPTAGGVKRLSGKALIGGYRSPSVGETELIGLPDDEPEIKITVSAALAGQLAYRLPSDDILTTEAIRAVISTDSGETTASSLTSTINVTANTQAIRVSIATPTAIRSNYPDRIAGTTASFNAPYVRVYVVYDSIIYQMPDSSISSTIDITDLGSAIAVGSLPSAASDFGLFGYGTVSAAIQDISPATTSLSSGAYQVAIAWYYPSPNDRVTSISHSESDGCIPEFIPLQDAIAAANQILTGTSAPTSGQGTENDVFLEVSTPDLSIYKKTSPDTWTLTGTVTAPTGATGQNAYTTTTASYVQPAIASSATVSFASTDWMGVGQEIFIAGGGLYTVLSKASSTSATIELTEVVSTAPVASTVASGKLASPGGKKGDPAGWTGALNVEGDPNGVIVARTDYDLCIDTIGSFLWWSAESGSTTWTQIVAGSGGGGS